MKQYSTLILLLLIAVVGVFTLDVYLPGMPAMADQFGVSIRQITYTFTGFSIVFAVTQLFHGAWSDSVGRKPVIIVGLSIAAVATWACIYAQSYQILFAARILQAMGISSFVVVNAIIRDLYTGAKAVQVRTMVATASGISISIAPTIGGLLQKQYSWQGGFMVSLVLIIMALLYSIICFNESNTNKANNKRNLAQLFYAYLELFKSPEYVSHIMIAMLAYTVHFAFIVMSADIFINMLGATPLVFGYLMIVYGGVYFFSGLAANFIAKKMTIHALIKLGSYMIGAGGILMFAIFTTICSGSWQVILPMSVITMGVTIVRASAITGALAPIPTQAGQGAAGLNLVQFALSAAIATGVSRFSDNPQLAIALLAIVSAFSIGFIRRRVAV